MNKKRLTICNYIIVVLMAVMSALFLNQAISLLGIKELSEAFRNVSGNNELRSMAERLLLSGLLVPFAEEIIFRGIIYRLFKKKLPIFNIDENKSIVIGVILSSFLFGAYHMNLVQFIYAFLMGMIICCIYEYMYSIMNEQAIGCAIVFHMSANCFVILAGQNSLLGTAPGKIVSMCIGAVGILFCSWGINKMNRIDFGKVLYLPLILLVSVLSLCVCLHFGIQKSGYYVDEYYTYTLSNGSQLGIAIENGKMNSTDQFLDQLVCDEDEAFAYGQCYVNNQNDVHPPLYYFLVHTVSSIKKGEFNKWIGISVNLLLLIPCLLLVWLISYEITNHNRWLTLLIFSVYAFSPSTISGVMLIRMYVQLQLFVMLYAYILLVDFKRNKLNVWGLLVPTFVTGFLGFLTQYYFVIAMFFMTFFYILIRLFLLILNKKEAGKPVRMEDMREFGLHMLAFSVVALASLISTYFVWPTSVFHIFKGYRGADSVSSLVSVTNIASRVKLFFRNLNLNVYGGLIIIVIAALLAGIVVVLKNRSAAMEKIKSRINYQGALFLALSSISYFLVIAKIGLKAGSASNRYVFPVYGIFIILSGAGLYKIIKHVFNKCKKTVSLRGTNYLPVMNKVSAAFVVTAIILYSMLAGAYLQKQVLYLYENEKQLEQKISEYSEYPMVVVQGDDGSYDKRIKDFLLRDEVFFADYHKLQQLDNEVIENASGIILYLAKDADEAEISKKLMDVNGKLLSYELIFTDDNGDYSIYIVN